MDISAIKILYEDNHLLVVVKPPMLPVQEDASGDMDLLRLLKAYVKEKYNKPGEAYLGLVHRLDRPVGGVMVFARTSKAAARLSGQFKGHGAKKRYAALVMGTPQPRAALRGHILREGSGARLCGADEAGAQAASLDYSLVWQAEGLSLLDVELHTGRHHQIRVQLAGQGLPIYGDQRYNGAAKPGEPIALFAYSLSFSHPTRGERLRFTALPQGGAWEGAFALPMGLLAQDIRLVYGDENLLVLNKPQGLETNREDGEGVLADTMENRLKALLGPAVYPVHRLDVNTTGLILFARNPAARESLDRALAARQVHKLYRCTVKGRPEPPAARRRAYCLKEGERVRVFAGPQAGGRTMETAYRTLSSQGDESELAVELLTGRTHQIRAHLAFLGHPLLGDDRYGDREWNRQKKQSLPRLCASRLSFSFPEGDMLCYMNQKTFSILPPWEQP